MNFLKSYIKPIITVFFIIFYSSLSIGQNTNKTPTYPYLKTFIQKDGSKIKLFYKGDNHINWFETEKGEKVLINSEGNYVYAELDSQGKMIPSEKLVEKDDFFLFRLFSKAEPKGEKDIFYNKAQIEKQINYNNPKISNKIRTKTICPTKGNIRMLTVLVEFSDLPHQFSKDKFEDMMNQPNYKSRGSFKDYYYKCSYGKLNISTDVIGWIKVDKPQAYYGGNNEYNSDSNPRVLLHDIIKQIRKLDIDFSKYDNNSDGLIDVIHIIHSGYGEESGEDPNAIWSHQRTLKDKIQVKGNYYVNNYFTSPELSSYKRNEITSIGVICHEYGHALGLMDYYDTDYNESGGRSLGLRNWDLMASGFWNDKGNTPAYTNAYSKYLLGWIYLKELGMNQDIVLNNIEENAEGYIISTRNKSEFFVLENRQKIGFDKELPHHGLLIYKIDRSDDSWKENEINISPDDEHIKLLRSHSLSQYAPFPGDNDVTKITDYTSPSNFLTRNRDFSHKGLIEIKESRKIISAKYIHDSRKYNKVSVEVSNEGEPVENAEVSIVRLHFGTNQGAESVQTDENGIVNFAEIGDGTYQIVVNSDKYNEYKKEVFIYGNTTINVELEKKEQLDIRIQENGENISNALIEIITSNSRQKHYTNSDGIAYFTNMKMDEYIVKITKKHYITKEEYINYSKPQEIIFEIERNKDSKDELILYPNPCHGEFTISYPLEGRKTLRIFDISGHLLLENKNLEGNENTINISNISPGVYIVVINSKNDTVSKKLIIK